MKWVEIESTDISWSFFASSNQPKTLALIEPE